MKTLLLIDANALIHRSFHALPPLTAPDGRPVGALYGLTRALLKTLADDAPQYIAAAFDRPEPTFRKEMYEDYKAHRSKAPDELIAQIIGAHALFEKMGIRTFELPGFEADDVIGTLATRFAEKDIRVVILTGDLDSLQLVRGTRVVVRTPQKGVSETVEYDDAAVRARFHLAPEQIIDYKGLVGDASDNIPGVPGAGPKTAELALHEFGTIEGIYERMPSEHKLAKKLLPYGKEALFSKKLATIKTDLSLPLASVEELAHETIDPQALRPYFEELGFQSIVRKMDARAPAAHPPRSLFSAVHEPVVEEADAVFFEDADNARKSTDLLRGKKMKVAYEWKPIFKTLGERTYPAPPFFDVSVAEWLLSPEEGRRERPTGVNELRARFLRSKTGLEKEGLSALFSELEMPLIPVLTEMETRGIAVDRPALTRLSDTMERELSSIKERVYGYAGIPFNIDSPKQLGEVLFGTLGLSGGKKTSTGQKKTDKDVLRGLAGAHPIVPLILEYRETMKMRSGFVEPLIAASEEDGRVHTTYLQTGAATGRLSSEKPNLQNIPQESRWAESLRAAFVPGKGLVFLSLDYSQLELRLLAHVSEDESLRAAFVGGKDIHTLTAAKVFGVTEHAVDQKMRRVAKTLNFGVIYGMGARAFASTSGFSMTDAARFIQDYFRAFPRVKVWQDSVKASAKERGVVENMNGRKRWFSQNAAPGEFERAAINMPLQSLGADIIKKAMRKAADILSERYQKNAFLLLSIHDELLFEVEEKKAEAAGKELAEAMEHVYSLSVPLTVEMKRGENWGTMRAI